MSWFSKIVKMPLAREAANFVLEKVLGYKKSVDGAVTSKNILASKTFWGWIVTIIPSLAALASTDELSAIGTSIAAAVGGILVIWGRRTAKVQVK